MQYWIYDVHYRLYVHCTYSVRCMLYAIRIHTCLIMYAYNVLCMSSNIRMCICMIVCMCVYVDDVRMWACVYTCTLYSCICVIPHIYLHDKLGMWYWYYTEYSVKYYMTTVHCALYSVQSIVYCTMYVFLYAVYIVHCTLYSLQCTVYCTMDVILYTVYSVLYFILSLNYNVYNVQ